MSDIRLTPQQAAEHGYRIQNTGYEMFLRMGQVYLLVQKIRYFTSDESYSALLYAQREWVEITERDGIFVRKLSGAVLTEEVEVQSVEDWKSHKFTNPAELDWLKELVSKTPPPKHWLDELDGESDFEAMNLWQELLEEDDVQQVSQDFIDWIGEQDEKQTSIYYSTW